MRHIFKAWASRFLRHVPTGHELERLTIDFYSERALATRPADIKVAVVLSIACGIAAFVSAPYFSKLNAEHFQNRGVTVELLAVSQAFQATLLTVLLAFAGLAIGHRYRLGAPLLQRWLNGQHDVRWDRSWPVDSALVGVLAASLTVLLTVLMHRWFPGTFASLPVASEASIIDRFLACFYSSISSEVQLRLFFLTLLVWLATRTLDRSAGTRSYLFAITVAAIVPGLGEILSTENVWSDISYTVLYPVLPEAVMGFAFGWIYWMRGLEMSIVAHFFGDCVTRVVVPLLIS